MPTARAGKFTNLNRMRHIFIANLHFFMNSFHSDYVTRLLEKVCWLRTNIQSQTKLDTYIATAKTIKQCTKSKYMIKGVLYRGNSWTDDRNYVSTAIWGASGNQWSVHHRKSVLWHDRIIFQMISDGLRHIWYRKNIFQSWPAL